MAMKINRIILIIGVFLVIIVTSVVWYLKPLESLVKNSLLSSSSTSTNTQNATDTGNVFASSSSLSLIDKLGNTPEGNSSFSANRDKLPPVIGKNGASAMENRLTDDGVFFDTNAQRVMQNLPELKRNSVLDQTAAVKLNDMFSKQYFEHVSPSGTSVSDLMDNEGYKFLVVGENLALGDFAGDAKVVAAWMASPGHRENILDKRYTEMGVAVGYGMYNGQYQWLAVQHFARPMSSCSSPSVSLKEKISNDKDDLSQREGDVTFTKTFIDKIDPSNSSFEATIASYNSLVVDYNNRLKILKAEIATYNDQVKNFNSCLDSVTTSTQ